MNDDSGARHDHQHRAGGHRVGKHRVGKHCAGEHRAGVVAAAAAAIVALAAACGGGSVPSATGGSTAYQKALAYAQCMRAHGEPGFPDPQSNGAIVINGKKDNLNGALMASADKACRHLLPGGGVMTPAQKQQALSQLLKFSACMRAHGLPNFPDPVEAHGGIGLSISPKSGLNPNSPQFQSAQQACRRLMPGPAGGAPGAKNSG